MLITNNRIVTRRRQPLSILPILSLKLQELEAIGDGLTPAEQQANLARVEPVHPGQHNKHQQPIKNKNVGLASHNGSIVALDELDDPEETSHPDQGARHV